MKSREHKIYVWYNIQDIEEVELELLVETYYNGIGSYECHGYRGFDKGYEVADVTKVDWDRSLYTDEQNDIIDKELDEIIETEEFQETVNITVFD